MDINTILHSRSLKWFALGTLQFLIIVMAFGLGTLVGFRKAEFDVHWRESYPRNFGPMHGLNPHGTVGEVMRRDGNELVIKGSDDVERVIVVSPGTLVREDGHNLNAASLGVDNQIVVIGTPDDQGKINARFIRVFPLP